MTAILFWSFSALLVSFAANIPPFFFVGITILTSFFIVMIYWLIIKAPIKSYIMTDYNTFLLYFVGIAGMKLCYTWAFHFAPPLELALINYTWPIILSISVSIIDKKKLSRFAYLGILTSAVGLFLALKKDKEISFSLEYWRGYVLISMNVAIWIWYSLKTKTANTNTNSLIGMYLPAGILFLLISAISEEIPQSFSPRNIIAIVGIAIAGLSYLFWDVGMKKGDRKKIAQATLLTPIFSACLLITFGSQHITFNLILGAFLVICGIFMVHFAEIKISKKIFALLKK